jgi:hypothetical protein
MNAEKICDKDKIAIALADVPNYARKGKKT